MQINDIAIRTADAQDRPAIARLAALDSRPVPAGRLLIAEVAGVPAAALAVESGSAVADPFRPTAEVVELLDMRAATLRGRVGRRRRVRLPRPPRLAAA